MAAPVSPSLNRCRRMQGSMGCTLGVGSKHGWSEQLANARRCVAPTMSGAPSPRLIPSGYASLSNSSSGSAKATQSPPPPCEGAGNVGTPVTGTYHTRVPSRPYVHQDHLTSASQFGARAPPLAIQNRSTPSARTRSDVHPSLSSEPRSISERVPHSRSIMKCAGTGGGDGVGSRGPRPSAPDRGEPPFLGLVESGALGGVAGRRASSLTVFPMAFA
mmetsp:Transcript_12104/g.48566  ORF Transcript_12104/g.48566 Transcript_12104/m.48566 type:complete len:217 (+) Transcript_12104:1277-1927(+)